MTNVADTGRWSDMVASQRRYDVQLIMLPLQLRHKTRSHHAGTRAFSEVSQSLLIRLNLYVGAHVSLDSQFDRCLLEVVPPERGVISHFDKQLVGLLHFFVVLLRNHLDGHVTFEIKTVC